MYSPKVIDPSHLSSSKCSVLCRSTEYASEFVLHSCDLLLFHLYVSYSCYVYSAPLIVLM